MPSEANRKAKFPAPQVEHKTPVSFGLRLLGLFYSLRFSSIEALLLALLCRLFWLLRLLLVLLLWICLFFCAGGPFAAHGTPGLSL